MRFNKQWLLVGFIVGLLFWVNAVIAATLHVPSDYETIQAAIDATDNGDIVLVADGIYTDTNLTWDGNVKHITVKSENGPDNCIIDCRGIKSGASTGRAFYFNNTNQTAADVIDGFTIINGSADLGGGIYCNNSSPAITDCIFTNNYASSNGGGIYCYNSSPAITDCEFTNNDANYGGGIALINSSPTITNCIIGSEEDGNYAEYEGGGIYIGIDKASVGTKTTLLAPSSPTITGCWITGNEANDDAGGGISCEYSTPTITDCNIEYNYAEGWEEYEPGYGGGIYCYESTPTITNCTIKDNSTDELDGGYGGGIYLEYSPSTITNCEISDNDSEYGGGIYITDDGRDRIGVKTIPEDPSSHTITNCEITENNADAGGGIYADYSDLIITNCTIASNNANIFVTSAKKEMIIGGNGIFAYDSSLTIRNSILWGNNEELPPNRLANGDPSGAQIDLYYYSDLDIDYSDVEGGREQGVYVDDETNNVVWGDNNISEDPSFIIAPVHQYHLHLGSPCIDAGTSVGAPLDDIDGQTRPFGEGVDIGSDEYVWECPVATGGGAVEVSLSGNAAFIGSEEIKENDLPDTGKPALTFPYGLLFLEIIDIEEGATVTVTLTFPYDIPTDAQYWKYNEITEEWYQFEFGDNDGDNVITLTLTDGGAGDMDGVANSIILDPGGIGTIGEEDKDDNKCFMESIFGIVKSNTEEIMLARHFRDTHLLSNPVGQIFVSAYYKTSPMLVGIIREYPVLRSMARGTLRPIIWMSSKLIE